MWGAEMQCLSFCGVRRSGVLADPDGRALEDQNAGGDHSLGIVESSARADASLRRLVGLILMITWGAWGNCGAQCTVNWITAAGGSWSNGQNWDTGDPPGTSDIVCIQLDGNFTVSVSNDVQVSGLILGSSSNQGTQALNIGSSYSLGIQSVFRVYESGYLQISLDGVVWGAVTAQLTNHGMVGSVGGQIDLDFNNFGSFQFVGTTRTSASFANESGATVSTFDSTSVADLQLEQGMENFGMIEMIGSDNLSITVTSGYQLINKSGGLIQTGQIVKNKPPKVGAAPPTIIGEVSNSGNILVGDNGLKLTGDAVASSNSATGAIELVYSDLSLDLVGGVKARAASSFTNLGSIDIGTGMSFDVATVSGKSGGRAASSFTNLGSIDIGTGASFNISQNVKSTRAASSFTNLGSIDIGTGATFLCEGVSLSNEQNGRGAEGVISGVGTLDISSAAGVWNNAVIMPGSPGIAGNIGALTIYGDLPQGSSATLKFDLAGLVQGSSYDVLDVQGALGKVGQLELSLAGGYSPGAGAGFEIIQHQGAEGSYASSTVFPALDGGLAWILEETQSYTLAGVYCDNGADLRILDVTQDKDPVSIDSILTFDVRLDSAPGNSNVIMTVDLGDNLILDQVDVGDCLLDGISLVCSWATLESENEVIFSVYPTISGDLPVSFSLGGDTCESYPPDNSWNATVHAIAAAPCDANDDGLIDENDLPVAAGQFFGVTAAGNPDCSDDGILDAQDLALIESQSGG